MKLPSVVRQIGIVNGNSRVYIEDYAYAYLSELKRNRKALPVKVALYGYTFRSEEISYYIVYGAAAVLTEETEPIKIRIEFFSDYDHLGYMKILQDTLLPGEKEGCFVFCEENVAMQRFLISCYQRKDKKLPVFLQKQMWGIGKHIFQKLMLIFMVILAAISVSTIDRYRSMCDFVVMAVKAIGELG